MATTRTPAKKAAGPPHTGDFVYTAAAGGTITLPPMAKAVNAAELRKFRNMTQVDILYYVIERDFDESELEAVDEVLSTMSIDVDVPDLIMQWQEHGRIALGESKAS